MRETVKYMALGLLTHVPKLQAFLTRGTGGTISSRYCYSIWLRHLVNAHNAGLSTAIRRVAEIGPGDSLGIGLSSLLSGAEQYSAFDIVAHASSARNLEIFDELCLLFQARAPIPGSEEFPGAKPLVEDCAFPHHILTEERLAAALSPSRLAALRASLESLTGSVRYVAPWENVPITVDDKVDLILSQAVLEHVDNLDGVYRAMGEWLAPGGYLSHQIDFRSHGTHRAWNGHLSYSDSAWRVIRGNRPFLLNRRTYSEHLALLNKYGFAVRSAQLVRDRTGLSREKLAPRFASVPDGDLVTSGAFLLCVKAPT